MSDRCMVRRLAVNPDKLLELADFIFINSCQFDAFFAHYLKSLKLYC
jgi:hypothetical protein